MPHMFHVQVPRQLHLLAHYRLHQTPGNRLDQGGQQVMSRSVGDKEKKIQKQELLLIFLSSQRLNWDLK